MNPKIILGVVVISLIGAYFILDLQQYFNLQFLKEQKEALRLLYESHPVLISTSYFVVYVLFAALAVPAAAILTLAGGAIFGFWQALVLVSFASTIGATLAFIFTRYLFHAAIQKKFGERLDVVNRGIETEGALYVFGLRLVPALPFVVVNSLLALTELKVTTFYWASQVGMLIGTGVYVYAGTQLAGINNIGDILSPALWLSFILLGVFPLVAKRALAWIKRRKSIGSNMEENNEKI